MNKQKGIGEKGGDQLLLTENTWFPQPNTEKIDSTSVLTTEDIRDLRFQKENPKMNDRDKGPFKTPVFCSLYGPTSCSQCHHDAIVFVIMKTVKIPLTIAPLPKSDGGFPHSHDQNPCEGVFPVMEITCRNPETSSELLEQIKRPLGGVVAGSKYHSGIRKRRLSQMLGD